MVEGESRARAWISQSPMTCPRTARHRFPSQTADILPRKSEDTREPSTTTGTGTDKLVYAGLGARSRSEEVMATESLASESAGCWTAG